MINAEEEKELNDAEQLNEKEISAYLTQSGKTVGAGEFDTAETINYRADIADGKKPGDYLGQVNIRDNDFTRDLKKYGIATSMARGAAQQTADLIRGVGNAAIGTAEVALVKSPAFADAVSYLTQGKPLTSEERSRLGSASNAVRNDWNEILSVAPMNEQDRKWAYQAAAVPASTALSVIGSLSMGPAYLAGLYATSQAGNIYDEMRQNGADINKAVPVSLVQGGINYWLEKFGGEAVLRYSTARSWQKYLFRAGMAEGATEAGQQAAEDVIMRATDSRRNSEGQPVSAKEIALNTLTSGVLGAFGGMLGAGLSLPMRRRFAKDSKKLLTDNGVPEAEAERLSQKAYGDENDVSELNSALRENAGIPIPTKEDVLEDAYTLMNKQHQAYMEMSDAEKQAMGEELADALHDAQSGENAVVKESMDIYDDVQAKATEAGYDKDEAEWLATTTSAFAKQMYNVTGETPREWYEKAPLQLEREAPADNNLQELETAQRVDESELTDAERERLEEREAIQAIDGKETDTERDEQKAEYDDIPFYQIAKQNEKLDAENPAYEGDTLDIGGTQKTVYNSAGERIAKSEAALRNFYDWFGDSKVTDGQGRPLVVYHGTNADFDTFSGAKIYNSSEGKGFNFSTQKETAEGFGNVMPVYLKLENPVYAYSLIDLVGNTYENDFASENQKAIRDAVYKVKENLEQKGYTFYDNVNDEMLDVYAKRTEAQEVLDGLLDLGGYVKEDHDEETLYKDIRQAEIDAFGIDGYVTDNYAHTGGTTYVAFSPEQIKSVQNRGSFSKDTGNIYYQDAVGSTHPEEAKGSYEYTPRARILSLFKTADHSTIVHETGHMFTIDYVRALEAAGRQDELQGFYNWLGIKDISEATHETWEKMARGFETYVMEGVAPNIQTESLFIRFRNFLLDVYNDIKNKIYKPEEINDDVRQFFDNMLAKSEELPENAEALLNHLDELKAVISGTLQGKEMAAGGYSVKELRDLAKLMTMRMPRKPKTLMQKIRAAGGIDTELAKHLGLFDEKKGKMHGFFKDNGALNREDSILDFLADEGYLNTEESATYEQKAAQWDNAVKLLENADKTYTQEEQKQLDRRNEINDIGMKAAEKLQGIDTNDVFRAITVLNKNNAVGVSKETLRYLDARLQDMAKAYKQIKKDIKADKQAAADNQAKVTDYVKKLDLTGDDKFKIMERIKRAQYGDEFDAIINKVNDLAREYAESRKKKILTGLIADEIKSSKPVKQTKQRYDYENNKLFRDLREYNKMTQMQAAKELAKRQIGEDMKTEDLIRERYLSYKSQGMKSSAELMSAVYSDLMAAKMHGLQAKSDEDFIKSLNREELKQSVISAIDANKADKRTLKTQFGNMYRVGFANLYSLIDSIASKKLAKHFEMETVLNDAQIRTFKQVEAITDKAIGIYGLKGKGQLLNKISEMGEIVGKLYNNDGVKVENISKIKILDMYNAVKNAKTRHDYDEAYGIGQVDYYVSLLSDADKRFADALMEDVNALYPETNKTYISVYGIDLPKVENYWPATSEHTSDTALLDDYRAQSDTPGSWKERAKGHVTPIPASAWEKYLKHVNENIYMANTAVKYKELADTFKSKRIENKIRNKYGNGVYNELTKDINALSINYKQESQSAIAKVMNSFINNTVLAKISVAPTVFFGQLASITNYAENIKDGTYYRNFAEGLSHPKETWRYMHDIEGDFLKTRYKGGYSESMARVLKEAESLSDIKLRLFTPGAKYDFTNLFSGLVRMGDIGAIIYGGYGQIQANLKAGMTLEQAKKEFEFSTLRSQQSSNAASLSSWQRSKDPFSRLFLAFKNTSNQYLRKMADATIEASRGEISKAQYAKTMFNYAVIQSAVFVMMKNMFNVATDWIFGDEDDDKRGIADGIVEQMVAGNFDAIPGFSNLLHYEYRKETGQYTGNLFSMVGFDDIARGAGRFAKEDKNAYDWIEIIGPFIEGMTGAPVLRYEKMLKRYLEE